MSRYIERDDIGSAVAYLPTKVLPTEKGIELVVPVTDVIEIIKNVPSIDIVRCGECKHGQYREDFDDYLCDQLGLGLVNDADFFCSYGERREP